MPPTETTSPAGGTTSPAGGTTSPVDVGGLSVTELVAGLNNDTETFARAGDCVVPEVIAELKSRAKKGDGEAVEAVEKWLEDAPLGSEPPADEKPAGGGQDLGDEKTAAEAEAEQARKHMEAIEALSTPMGGEPVSRLLVQVTGGSIEMPASAMKDFQRDSEVTLTIRGWVKTGKDVTLKKGGAAAREMVVVLGDIEAWERVPDPQLALGE